MQAETDDGQLVAIDAAWRARFRRRLLTWYRKHARDLPWRRTSDAYRVWVSEIMLQQTQVKTVERYFGRFIERFPTVSDLAAADESEVLRLWEGLGYYRRARGLHAAAQVIERDHGGQFPRDFQTLLSLPGLGRYTAGAVLSIADGQRLPILEANTIRLLSRLVALPEDPTRAKSQRLLWSLAEELLPRKEPGTFNQALMELGSRVCMPKSPDCGACPALGLCAAQRLGITEQIPPAKRTVYESVTEVAVVVRRGRRVLLRRCAADERWAGLWDFPRFAVTGGPRQRRREVQQLTAEQVGVQVAVGQKLTTIRHGVTRFRIELQCYEAEFLGDEEAFHAQVETKWLPPADLEPLPLSVTGRKLARLIAE